MLNKIRFYHFIFFAIALFSSNIFLNAQEKTDEDIIKVDTNFITIPVIVSDRNDRYISGLKAQNFNVFQDNQLQKIEYFVAEEAPINVAILLDTSRSTARVLETIQDAALDFVDNLKKDDKCLIVSFDSQVNILSELTSDKRKLENAIYDAQIGERFGTTLYDAVYETVNGKFADVKGRKAVILLTDGKDFGSDVEKDELINRLQESDAMVYTIFYETGGNMRAFRQRRFPFPNGGGMGRRNRFPERARQKNDEAKELLNELADITAGRFYESDTTDFSETFALISNELRKQYLIGYYPEKVESGKTYQIKVKTDRNNAVVRYKNTYRMK